MKELVDLCRATGARREQYELLFVDWLAGRRPGSWSRRMPPPRSLIEAVPEIERRLGDLARVVSEHLSRDGSCRLRIELARGGTVESVLLARDALCISTQVGCAVGCRFCKTGERGLQRQLSTAEILAQVALSRARRPVERVVLMGMGEPAHNLHNVLEALSWLGREGRFAHKKLVFSTVGDRQAFERLVLHAVKPALALSLHTTRDALRAELLPRAPRIPVRELIDLACGYADAITWPLQVQWTLLEGINDGDDEVEALIELLLGKRAIVNFIPWNRVDGFDFKRPPRSRAVAMVRSLRRAGVLATIRRSGGADVDAACGQLHARHAAEACNGSTKQSGTHAVAQAHLNPAASILRLDS